MLSLHDQSVGYADARMLWMRECCPQLLATHREPAVKFIKCAEPLVFSVKPRVDDATVALGDLVKSGLHVDKMPHLATPPTAAKAR